MFAALQNEDLDRVISILETPLSCQQDLQFTAQPNGFRCISFGPQFRDHPQIRLHIWPGGVIEGDIHDHAWDYSSLCVFGKLEMTKYIEMSNGEPYAHYLCSSTVATGNDSKVLEFEYLGRTYLQPLPMRTIIQGEVYNLASNELHRVVANTEKEFAAITIMKRDVYQRNVTNVYVSLSDVKQPEASFRRANKNMPFDSKSPEIKWCIQELKNFRAY